MRKTFYPRPEILARPELSNGHVVIEASAGTGKTFTLEHLVIDLLINCQANIEEILVVTFTDAATRELRERIRTLIRRLCDWPSENLPADNQQACWAINEATRIRLREALFRFDGAAISTIHGFCQRILSEQAFLGKRLFEQEHAEGSELFGFAFREELRTALAEKSATGEALRSWVKQNNPLQDLQEFLYRCQREGCPERCGITPAWDPEGLLQGALKLPAAAEIKKAGREFFENTRTFSAFERLIDELFTTVETMKRAGMEEESASLFMEWAGKKRTLNKINDTVINHICRFATLESAPEALQILGRTLEVIAGKAAPQESFFAHALLPRVQERLSRQKENLGLIDYDDMLLGVQQALNSTNAATLLKALRSRWKYALVDEFQDTDPVQWDIFRRIFVDGQKNQRLFIIGDPKQAIYGFRGADVHTYEKAKSYLIKDCGASRLPLIKNFRSTKAMIDAVNNILLAEDNQRKHFFNGINYYKDPVEAGDTNLTATIEGKPATPLQLIHFYSIGEKPAAPAIRQGLARFIAEEIIRLTDRNRGLLTSNSNRALQPIKLSDIYILTRSAREGRQIGAVLRRYGIVHAYYKQEGLFKTDEADNVHRLLRAIAVPTEPALRMAAWLTPFFAVPLEELDSWKNVGENHLLVTLLLKWKRLADMQAWSVLFDDILSASGLVRRLIFFNDERALTNYLHIFELLLKEAHSRPLTTEELARSLKARIEGRKMPEGREGDIQRLETEKEAVQILTMHKAKGLEAEVVFIGGGITDPGIQGLQISVYHCNGKRYLHIGRAVCSLEDAVKQEESEENQRLAYVALTRAKSRLYLPYFGKAFENTPSERIYGFNRLGSFYKALQKQLDLLRDKGFFNNHDHFAIRDADCSKIVWQKDAAEPEPSDLPDEKLLEKPTSSAARAAAIEKSHRGVLLTSYSRIKNAKEKQASLTGKDDQESLLYEERSEETDIAENSFDILMIGKKESLPVKPGLPGGRATGLFLHALLEEAAEKEIGNLSYAEWSALPTLQAKAESAARRHGFSQDYLPQALALIYDALKTPLCIESREGNNILEMPGGIEAGKQKQSEMAFVYPIPESYHPLLGKGKVMAIDQNNDEDPPFKALRGYLQGLIDLAFEFENKVYLLDWKSDRLPTYDQAIINAHVEKNYALQARIYSLAIIRLLKINNIKEYEERFGGVLYIFIRGIGLKANSSNMADSFSQGAWYSLPLWDEIMRWEKDLINSNDWGGKVIERGVKAGNDRY